jgi:hypothetical protein
VTTTLPIIKRKQTTTVMMMKNGITSSPSPVASFTQDLNQSTKYNYFGLMMNVKLLNFFIGQ